MTAPAQLAFVTDPRADDLPAQVIAAIEAKIAHDDLTRPRYAPRARTCCCPRPWGEPGHCVRCGRDLGARR